MNKIIDNKYWQYFIIMVLQPDNGALMMKNLPLGLVCVLFQLGFAINIVENFKKD